MRSTHMAERRTTIDPSALLKTYWQGINQGEAKAMHCLEGGEYRKISTDAATNEAFAARCTKGRLKLSNSTITLVTCFSSGS